MGKLNSQDERLKKKNNIVVKYGIRHQGENVEKIIWINALPSSKSWSQETTPSVGDDDPLNCTICFKCGNWMHGYLYQRKVV